VRDADGRLRVTWMTWAAWGNPRRMAAAQGTPRVGDGGQVDEQVRGLGFLERAGIAKPGQARRDRARWAGRHGPPPRS
jgi:hypothetical protein